MKSKDITHMKPIIQLAQNKEYKSWVKELKKRYLTARLKASVEANRGLLEYYWSLGRDIADRQYANTYGSAFYATLSHDLRTEIRERKVSLKPIFVTCIGFITFIPNYL